MQNISSLYVFIFGLLIGSFLNVVIFWLEGELKGEKRKTVIPSPSTTLRIEDEESRDPSSVGMTRKNLFGRSFCPSCKHQLNSKDLIPVISWMFLRAKCRYCKKPISIQYPLVELGTGLIFVLTYWFTVFPMTYDLSNYATITSLILLLTVNCLLLIVFVYDLKHKIIPDKVIYPAILLAISYQLSAVGGGLFSLNSFLLSIASALVAGGFFYFLAAVSDGKWMGGGDIKLAFLMGLLLGFPNILVGLFLGFSLGAIVGIVLMLLQKAKMQSEIPFGPFLITGTWIALFWGDKVVEWYMKAFL